MPGTPPRLDTAAHLVAHLFREIESAIRAVLLPNTQTELKNGHRAEIDAILEVYELDQDATLVAEWHQLTGNGELNLARHAHRDNLARPRALDVSSRRCFSRIEAVFDMVLDRFEENFHEALRKVDALVAKHTPTGDDLKALRTRVPNNLITLERFFSQVTDPAWLDLLDRDGTFAKPPQPIPDEENDAPVMPPWPASRYLARMAAVPELQERVAEIALNVPSTQNFRVHEDLADVALALPMPLALRFLDQARTWCRDPVFSRVADKIGGLIERCLGAAEVEAALDLAGALFDPDNRPATDLQSGHKAWAYVRALNKLAPMLVEAGGVGALEILTSCLVKLVRGARGSARAEKEEFSYVWRPAIESHDQNPSFRGDARVALLTAVRDGAEAICVADPSQVATVVQLLEAVGSPVLDRIVLHLLRVAPEVPLELVASHLLDRDRLDKSNSWHEYTLLAWSRLGDLRRDQQVQIVQWAVDSAAQRATEGELGQNGDVEVPEDQGRRARAFEFRALERFRDVLPDEFQACFERLEQEFKSNEHPEFLSYHSVWAGPTSPKTADEMRLLPVEELVAYFKEWIPEIGLMGPTREGLAQELSNLVAAEPERFAAAASLFRELRPSYVRGLIGGFGGAAHNGPGFDWKPVLKLCSWVVEQDAPRGSSDEVMEATDAWAGSRSEIAHLLLHGLRSGEQELPFDFRGQVWAIVEQLASDPEPTPEYEGEFIQSSDSAYDRATDTIRGTSMVAAIQYGLWVRRHLGEPSTSFDSMQEVRSLLEAHLEPSVDPSLAVRSIYGRWLPWIHLLDPGWTAAHIGQIFPADRALEGLRQAAWDTYILYCRPYDEMLPILRDQYRQAVSDLGQLEEPNPRRLDEHIAEHVMAFYLRGKLGLQDELLVGLFERAAEEIRRHVLRFVGRVLPKSDDSDAALSDRATALWERRAANLDTEGVAFGWWFAASALDAEWRLAQLEVILSRNPSVEADHSVFEEFVVLIGQHPVRVIDCARRMIEEASYVELFSWRRELRQILESALCSENSEAVRTAKAIIGILAARGETEYSSLLNSSS